MSCMKCCKLAPICPVSLGLAIGIACGLFMMAYAWIAAFWGYGTAMIEQYGAFYYGYAPTGMGGLIGGLWGLLEGFIFGAVIALFYDLFACCCRKSNGSCKCGSSGDQVK